MEQQRACEFISDSGQNSSIFSKFSRDRYDFEVYDQFINQNEPMITNDYIGNYMFLADHNPCHSNIALSSFSKNFSEEEVVMIDDQDLIIRELEDGQSFNRGIVMVEQEATIDV